MKPKTWECQDCGQPFLSQRALDGHRHVHEDTIEVAQ